MSFRTYIQNSINRINAIMAQRVPLSKHQFFAALQALDFFPFRQVQAFEKKGFMAGASSGQYNGEMSESGE